MYGLKHRIKHTTVGYFIVLWITCWQYITLCQSDDSTCEDGYSSFYEFTYCLSDTSYCSQCEPCWNDHNAYLQQNGTIEFCNNNKCSECSTNCEDNFESSHYTDYLNDICSICKYLCTY